MGTVIAGIDYGSKTSGFTCAAFLICNKVYLHQATKNQNADKWLMSLFEEYACSVVGIDAPLSIPGVLRGLDGFSNYHYRMADLEAKAMSPMFLGGLTARAMELKDQIERMHYSRVIEVYPKLAAMELELDMKRYKKDRGYLKECLVKITEKVKWSIDQSDFTNWHQFDALLALISTEKFTQNTCSSLGNKEEGLIYF